MQLGGSIFGTAYQSSNSSACCGRSFGLPPRPVKRDVWLNLILQPLLGTFWLTLLMLSAWRIRMLVHFAKSCGLVARNT
jgi:hypothetical protein